MKYIFKGLSNERLGNIKVPARKVESPKPAFNRVNENGKQFP